MRSAPTNTSSTESALEDVLKRCSGPKRPAFSTVESSDLLVELAWTAYSACTDDLPIVDDDSMRSYGKTLWTKATAACHTIDQDAFAGTTTGAIKAIVVAVQSSNIPNVSDRDISVHGAVQRCIRDMYEAQVKAGGGVETAGSSGS
jgi:hypothetical protein